MHVHRYGNEEVLGEFLSELSQVFSQGLLVCPFPKVDFPPYRFLCWKITGTHKYHVMVTYARQGITPFNKQRPNGAKRAKGQLFKTNVVVS